MLAAESRPLLPNEYLYFLPTCIITRLLQSAFMLILQYQLKGEKGKSFLGPSPQGGDQEGHPKYKQL